MIKSYDHGDVRELRLDRPPANALVPELISALREGVASAPREGARAVVISGGPSLFSGGLDIPHLIQLNRDAIAAAWRDFYAMMRALAASPVPVAAAIGGHAPAGGAVISLFCDARFLAAKEDGEYRIGLNEVAVGIPLPAVIFRALQRQVGPRQAERMSVTAELLPASEALRIGLIDEIVPAERVVERAVEWCRALLALPAEALEITRRMARADLVALFEDNADEVSGLVDQWFSPATQGPLREVVERLASRKRRPE